MDSTRFSFNEPISIDRLPLLDLAGNPVSLQKYFDEYLLLIFLRHLAWLPCQSHLGEVKTYKAEFDRRGVSVVVVSFAEPGKLVHYQELHKWPFTILADPVRAAYRTFTLTRLSWFRVFSPATLKLYWRLLRAGHRHQDYGKEDIYQAGGDFILDRRGRVLFAHRSQDPSDRPAAQKLLDAIDRIKGEQKQS